MNKKDYYEILGVSKQATDQELKSAYRKLAKKYHPDVSKEPDAEKKFKEVEEAYSVLSDSNKRKTYDQFGHNAFNNNSSGYGYSNASGFDFGGFDFSDLFGESDLGDIFGFGSKNRNRKNKGQDLLYQMEITFLEAALGSKKTITIDTWVECNKCDGHGGFHEHTCPDCHGSGSITKEQRTIFGSFMSRTVCPTCKGSGKTFNETCSKCHGIGKVEEKKKIEVEIPSGIENGNRLRLSNLGEMSSNGGPNGDLYIEFIVRPSKVFKRENDDIYVEVPITIKEAILGGLVIVPTIKGNIEIEIDAGISNLEKQRIKNRGIYNETTNNQGDMYVVFNVITPKNLTKEELKIFGNLDNSKLRKDREFKEFDKHL